jgi:hypothetical protein
MTGICKAWNGESLSHTSHSPLEDADTAGVFHIPHRCGEGYMYVITPIHIKDLGRYHSRAESPAVEASAPARAAESSLAQGLSAAEPPGLSCE